MDVKKVNHHRINMQHNKIRKHFAWHLGSYYFYLNVVPKLGMLTNSLYLMYFVLNFSFLIKIYITRTKVWVKKKHEMSECLHSLLYTPFVLMTAATKFHKFV